MPEVQRVFMAARLTTAKESSIYQTPEAEMIRREGSHMSTDMNIGSRTTRRQQIGPLDPQRI